MCNDNEKKHSLEATKKFSKQGFGLCALGFAIFWILIWLTGKMSKEACEDNPRYCSGAGWEYGWKQIPKNCLVSVYYQFASFIVIFVSDCSEVEVEETGFFLNTERVNEEKDYMFFFIY